MNDGTDINLDSVAYGADSEIIEVPKGTLGLSINKDHPLVIKTASDTFTTPGWYHMIKGAGLSVLDEIKGWELRDIVVRGIDNIERNHSLGLIYIMEKDGKEIIACNSRLLQMTEYPEVRCLLKSFYDYVSAS